jgi:formylglycine-generating enzyme required for sulfatase activity
MKLFISYARVDQTYCVQIVNRLDNSHDVWFDRRLFGGDNWWDRILQQLAQCEGFVYLVSQASVESEYCLKELDIAIQAKRAIIPVLIESGTEIPEPIRHLHYVDLIGGLTVDSITALFDAITFAERNYQPPADNDPSAIPTQDALEPPVVKPGQVIQMGVKAMEKGNYDRALFLFKQARFNGEVSPYVDVDRLLRMVEAKIARDAEERDLHRDYNVIEVLVSSSVTRQEGLVAFEKFRSRFPDYDPNNLVRYLNGQAAAQTDTDDEPDIVPDTPPPNKPPNPPPFKRRKVRVPRIDMVEVPSGVARVEELGDDNFGSAPRHKKVKTFRMSRYPVTHEQFAYFLDSEDGYCDERWWKYSKKARAWWLANQRHPPNQFGYPYAPRETVSWYSAVAFSQWLSYHMKARFLLPHLLQWQRAVQGDDNRMFPWGDDYEPWRCNTRERNLKKTSPVNMHPRGASPYGIHDLAGNTWEWCMDFREEEDIREGQRIRKRAVVGGSYKSPLERAQVGFHYYLHPDTPYSTIGFRVVEILD